MSNKIESQVAKLVEITERASAMADGAPKAVDFALCAQWAVQTLVEISKVDLTLPAEEQHQIMGTAIAQRMIAAWRVGFGAACADVLLGNLPIKKETVDLDATRADRKVSA